MKIATIKNIQNLFDEPVSKSTACRWIRECRDSLGKSKDKILTVEEFCKYHSIPVA